MVCCCDDVGVCELFEVWTHQVSHLHHYSNASDAPRVQQLIKSDNKQQQQQQQHFEQQQQQQQQQQVTL